MDWYSFFSWIENSALGVWMRESPSLWAFPFILILHTIGMAFLVGPNIAIDLRILGVAPRVPASLMEKFFVVMKLGFVINLVSGLMLLVAYPTKALTNPLFYIKLLLIAIALTQTMWMRKNVLSADSFPFKGKVVAAASLVTWAAAVGAGRFLAYTYKYLLAGELL